VPGHRCERRWLLCVAPGDPHRPEPCRGRSRTCRAGKPAASSLHASGSTACHASCRAASIRAAVFAPAGRAGAARDGTPSPLVAAVHAAPRTAAMIFRSPQTCWRDTSPQTGQTKLGWPISPPSRPAGRLVSGRDQGPGHPAASAITRVGPPRRPRVQYVFESYRAVLEQHGIMPSMSLRSNCLDNLLIESFFASLKTEHVHQVRCHAGA
jgi:hypothetical protein